MRNIPPKSLTWLAGRSTMNEDVFPIEDGDVPASHVSFLGKLAVHTCQGKCLVYKKKPTCCRLKVFSSMFLLPKLTSWDVEKLVCFIFGCILPLKINHPCRYSRYTIHGYGMGFVSFTASWSLLSPLLSRIFSSKSGVGQKTKPTYGRDIPWVILVGYTPEV